MCGTIVVRAVSKRSAQNPRVQRTSARSVMYIRAEGERLWQRHACAGCHAPGTPVADKLESVDARYTLQSLADYFGAPTTPMPVFPLSEAERRSRAIHLLANARAAATP